MPSLQHPKTHGPIVSCILRDVKNPFNRKRSTANRTWGGRGRESQCVAQLLNVSPEQKFVPIKKINFLRNHKKLIFQRKLEFLKKLIFRKIYENLDSPSRKKLIKIKKIKKIKKLIFSTKPKILKKIIF